MQQIILIFHVVFAVALIALVLIQQGKGATVGASFGAGASQTVFGSAGAGSFMLKITGLFAFLFFATSLWLGHMTAKPVATVQSTILDNAAKISQVQSQQQQIQQNQPSSNQAAKQAVDQLNGALPVSPDAGGVPNN